MALSPLPPLPDPTLNHLTSLPPTLQSLSPPLAALHMARLRLLLEIPTSPSYQIGTSMKGTGGWCHLCGGLREGLGGADRGWRKKYQHQQPYPSSSSSSSSSLSGLSEMQRKRGTCTTCNAPFSRPKPDLSTLKTYQSARSARARRAASAPATALEPITSANALGSTTRSLPTSSSAHGIPNEESGEGHVDRANGVEIETGGLLFSPFGDAGPSTSVSVSGSADKVDDTDATERMDVDHPIGSSPGTRPSILLSGDIHTDQPNISSSLSHPAEAAAPTSTPATATAAEPVEVISTSTPASNDVDTQPTSPPKQDVDVDQDFDVPARPSLLSRPSLKYLPKSSPNLPTYPPPPPRSMTPSFTPGKPGASGGPGGRGGGAKRKKRSGLAKLLAESKEREEASAAAGSGAGGMWGLN